MSRRQRRRMGSSKAGKIHSLRKMAMDEKQWVVNRNGQHLVAVQHGCGVGDAPVNCYVDEHHNWTCPNCGATYGAAFPLQEWQSLLNLVGAIERMNAEISHMSPDEQRTFERSLFYEIPRPGAKDEQGG